MLCIAQPGWHRIERQIDSSSHQADLTPPPRDRQVLVWDVTKLLSHASATAKLIADLAELDVRIANLNAEASPHASSHDRSGA